MVELEARALKALDEITLAWLDLVLAKFSRLGAIPGDSVALMSDMEFSWADSEMLALLQDSGGTFEQD